MSKSKSYDQFKLDWMDLGKKASEEGAKLHKEVVVSTGAAGISFLKKQLMDQMIQFGTAVTTGTSSMKWVGLTSTTTGAFSGSFGPSPGIGSLAWQTYPYSNGWLSHTSEGHTVSIAEALQMWLRITNPEMLYIRYYDVSTDVITREVKLPGKGSKKKYHLLIPKSFYDPALFPKAQIVGSQPYYSPNLNYHIGWNSLYVDGSPTPLFLTALKNTKIISFENTRRL